MTTQKPHHFFVCNVQQWHVGTDLHMMTAYFEKEKLTYWVWLVPGDKSSLYEIAMFAPQVKGSKLLHECVFQNGRRSNPIPRRSSRA